MKNHEKGNHCKTLNNLYHVKECSFQKEKLTKLVEIYKFNYNASVEDSNFNLEEVKGEPKYKEGNLVWEELPQSEGTDEGNDFNHEELKGEPKHSIVVTPPRTKGKKFARGTLY